MIKTPGRCIIGNFRKNTELDLLINKTMLLSGVTTLAQLIRFLCKYYIKKEGSKRWKGLTSKEI